MSPWLRKELRVILGPEQVMLLPLGGVRRRLQEPLVGSVEGAPAAQPWRAALLALETALPAAAAKGKTTATVVLSNQFLRYALVPWQAGLADAQEDLSYARHCFAKVYGKAALQWEVRLSHQAPGRPRLASGVDAELLEGLRSIFAATGSALQSIQPHLMTAFNDARGLLRGRNAWLALLEPGHLCLALLRDGLWASVRSMRMDSAWRRELPTILEREAFLVDDAAVPHDVYVGQLEPGELVLPELDGWQFQALAPALGAGSACPQTGQVALTAAG